MSLYHLRKNIRQSAPYFEALISLINVNFKNYTETSHFFQKNLYALFADEGTKKGFLNELRKRIFDIQNDNIKSAIDDFNKLKFKLQDLAEKEQNSKKTLTEIKNIATTLSGFFTHHFEICKYRKENFSDQEIAYFIIEIDRINNEWNSCLSRYIENCNLVDNEPSKAGGNTLNFICALPENHPINTLLISNVLEIINHIFEITNELLGIKEKQSAPVINAMEAENSIYFNITPKSQNLAEIAGKFFQYLVAENIKSEPLILHALETTRQKTKAGITSTVLKSRVKKLTGLLKKLPDGAFFQLDKQADGDDPMIISQICSSIQALKKNPTQEARVKEPQVRESIATTELKKEPQVRESIATTELKNDRANVKVEPVVPTPTHHKEWVLQSNKTIPQPVNEKTTETVHNKPENTGIPNSSIENSEVKRENAATKITVPENKEGEEKIAAKNNETQDNKDDKYKNRELLTFFTA